MVKKLTETQPQEIQLLEFVVTKNWAVASPVQRWQYVHVPFLLQVATKNCENFFVPPIQTTFY